MEEKTREKNERKREESKKEREERSIRNKDGGENERREVGRQE